MYYLAESKHSNVVLTYSLYCIINATIHDMFTSRCVECSTGRGISIWACGASVTYDLVVGRK